AACCTACARHHAVELRARRRRAGGAVRRARGRTPRRALPRVRRRAVELRSRRAGLRPRAEPEGEARRGSPRLPIANPVAHEVNPAPRRVRRRGSHRTRPRAAHTKEPPIMPQTPNRLRLRSAIYPVAALPAARKWYAGWLGLEPYFEEPFY